MNSEGLKICSYCSIEYSGWGNNGLPLVDGRVCNDCNDIVICLRLEMAIKSRGDKSDN